VHDRLSQVDPYVLKSIERHMGLKIDLGNNEQTEKKQNCSDPWQAFQHEKLHDSNSMNAA